MAKKVVLAGACRTAIGKMGGGLQQDSGTSVRFYCYRGSS